LSEKLTAANIRHQVLNAKQNEQEAQIVAEAGKRGKVTIATNMAGRGTDIKLGPTVADAGGLRVDVIAGVPFVADFPERVWASAGLLREPRRGYTATQAPDRLRAAVNRYYPVNAKPNRRRVSLEDHFGIAPPR